MFPGKYFFHDTVRKRVEIGADRGDRARQQKKINFHAKGRAAIYTSARKNSELEKIYE